MIQNGLEFHHVAELEDRGPLGLHLQRFPRLVREHAQMNELGRLVMQKAMGAEIRFVSDAPRLRISLGALEQDNQVVVLKGDFAVSYHTVPAGRAVHLLVNRPEAFDYFRPAYFDRCRFSPNVWRIWMGQECALFLGLDTFGSPVRPPHPTEKPSVRWLAYGSSFTMGGGAATHFNNYVTTAARLLGVDALNCGMGGSCLCEYHVADHLAERADWDFCTLRIGGNMIGVIDPAEYRRRVEHLLDTLTARHPDRPVLFIGMGVDRIPYHRECRIWQEHTLAYHRIDQEIFRARSHLRRLFHCTQDELMPDHTMVRADHLHPDDLGYFTVATNLAARIRDLGMVSAASPKSP